MSPAIGADDLDARGSLPNVPSKDPHIARRRSRGSLPRLHLVSSFLGGFNGGGSGGARSQIVLNYGILAPLCDPILDRVPSYRATHQVAALHKAIEGDADVQFANIAPAPTGSS
jgi:hypothetical protein